MKPLLILPLVALVAACSTVKGPESISAQSDEVKLARLDLRICAIKHAAELTASSQDSARDIARTAVGNCMTYLYKLEEAFLAENADNRWKKVAADSYIKSVHDRTIDEMASLVMKERGAQGKQ